jgi:hypothetical protein
MSKLKKWWEVYPAGTQAGDEEKKFFVAIARNPKYVYRSVGAIATETGLTKTRVEEIIQKYWKKGMLLQNEKHHDQWGYWETVGVDPLTVDVKSIADEDKDARVTKAKKP